MDDGGKKKKRKKSTGAPDWIVTYGDVMTLLLTFFIMLLSTAKIEGEDFRLILANFPGIGRLLGGESFNEGRLPNSGQIQEALPSIQKGNALDKLKSRTMSILNDTEKKKVVTLQLTERGLVVSLASDVFFEKNSAVINLDGNIDFLRRLSSLLREILSQEPPTNIKIEGHTDEKVLPTGSPYIDEWGLSSARAVSLLRFFGQMLVPTDHMQTSGFGNTRPRYKNESGGESPFNRRVDIVILNEGNL